MGELYTGGQLVVKVLEEFGARVVFGVPGGQTLFVTDPIQDTKGMRFVHTRHSIQKVDTIVDAVVRIQFAKIKAANRGQAIAMQRAREIEFESERYRHAQRLYEEKGRELEDLKAETLKVIRGTSELNMSFLNGLVEETMTALKAAEQNMQEIKAGLEELQQSAKRAAQEYDQLLSWADVYDQCPFEAKKMIVSQFVKAVYVHRGYDLEIEFNVSFEDFQRLDCNEEVLTSYAEEALPPSA